MRRSRIGLEDVADWANLCRALRLAARGKRRRPEVAAFFADWQGQLRSLAAELRSGMLGFSPLRGFWIHDPKRRWIEAPRFRERVAHHALMAVIEPTIDRVLVHDTFASRLGKGTLAAVQRAQHHLRRNTWCVQADVVSFYRQIDHARLLALLHRLFRDRGLLRLLSRLLTAYASAPGRGLPIGALPSQALANLYLAELDRYLLEGLRVPGMVRYMDDVSWFLNSRAGARGSLDLVRGWCAERRDLSLHRCRVTRCSQGITLLGYRVHRNRLGLTRRRRARYRAARKSWEAAHGRGAISAEELQRGHDAALAITAHADAVRWRRRELQRRPAPDA